MRSVERRPVSVLLVSFLVLTALGAGCTVSPTAERSSLLGSWTPASLPSLRGWWDASAIAAKRDGDPIATWADRSGLGHDLLSGGAGHPTYKVAIQNGLPVVRFDGTSNWMSKAWAQAQPVTICIVFRYRGTVTTYPQKDLVDNGSGTTAGLMTLAPMGANGHLDIHGYNVVNGPPIGADTWYTATAVFNGASSMVEVNGGTPFPGNADTPAPGGIALGGRITNSEFAPVDIGEVFILAGALSNADRAQADQYLGAKWGITIPPPVGWTPASLPGLKGWWDASAIAGKRDGDPITTWADRSGLGHDLLSGGAGHPTYKVAIQNGLPVVRFDGTSNWMSKAWAQAQPVTICIVFRYRGTVTTYPQKDLVDNGSGTTAGLMTLAPMGANGHLDIHGYNVVNGPPIGADTWYTATAVFNGASSMVEVNGGTPFPGNADTPAPGGIALGGRITNSEFAPVDIGEVFILAGALSNADRAQADQYLGAKWGLTTPPPPPGPVGFAGPDQTVAFGTPVRFAATPAANLPYRFWAKMSGPGVVHIATEQFNSSFEDPTFSDWIGANPVSLSNGTELQGVDGTWQTIQYAVPSTDHVRSGTYGWKARTSLDWQHSAKLLRWRFDDATAYYSVWCYWPSNLIVNGHGSAGFTDYLNLFQWKERTSPWNPTWVVAVSGKSGTTTLDEFIVHDWYNNQPIVHTGVTVPKDQWFNLTAYMKEGFGTSGQIIVWLNNQIIFNQAGLNTLGGTTNTNPSHLMWGIGNYSNALVGQGGESLYFDDALVVPGQNNIATTTATFTVRGTYVLRLTASDGTQTATDDMTITVQ